MPSFERFEPNRISINGLRHYQCLGFPNIPEGMVLPSVTTVLSSMAPVSKIMALINWRKRVGTEEANRRTRLAANRGTWLHAVLEDWFEEEDIEHHLEKAPDWRPYFQAAEPFLQGIEEPILVESAVAWFDAGQGIGFSGTLDMVARMTNGTIALVDWKTSYKEKPDYQLADYKRQLGAYAMAAEQMYQQEIDEAWCVIACYDPEKEDSEPVLQLVHLDGFELVSQQRVMADTVKRYFSEHYPGGKAFAMTADKG
jgi:genome maintenance exonuclease 1